MKIQNAPDHSLYTRNQEQTASERQEKVVKEDVKSIDASALNLGQDSIAQRKDQAQKEAMDIIKSQFKSDGRIDKSLAECRTKIADSKGKAEAIIEEYNYIYHILEKDENKLLFFAPQYQLKKYHNYLFHYNRIANEEKLAFLEKVSEEFKLALSKGEIDPEFFNSHELDEVEWIANNPKDYFFQHNDESIAVSVIIPVYKPSPI